MQLLYGFEQLADQLQQQIVQVDEALLISAVQMSAEEHNRQINTILTLFADDTVDFKKRFESSFPTKNQKGDENSKAKPIKAGTPYETAFPIFHSTNAWGGNFVALNKMTVQRFNKTLSMMYEGDARYTRDCVLAALFNNTNGGRGFADEQFGNLSVQGLANGDNVLYVVTGKDKPQQDSHYLGQAAAIADGANPYATIWTELMEHPENQGGEIVTFIPQNLEASTEGLSTFVPVPDRQVILGVNTPKLAEDIDVFQASLGGPVGVTLPASARVLGRTNKQWVVLWPALPDNYIVSLVTGVDEGVLLRRQDPEEVLRGFKPEAELANFPFFSEQWFRRQGFGGWNRVRACVMLIGNANYSIPAGYDAFEP